MPKHCVICKASFDKKDTRSFHRFPKDEIRRNRWQEIIGREIIITVNTCVCSDHFSSHDYVLRPSGIKILKPDAIPVIASTSKSSQPQTESEYVEFVEPLSKKMRVMSPPRETEIQSVSTASSPQSGGSSPVIPQRHLKPRILKLHSPSSTLTASSSATLTASETGLESLSSEKLKARFQEERPLKKRRYTYIGDFKEEDMKHPDKARKFFSLVKKQTALQKRKSHSLMVSTYRLRDRITNLNSLLSYLRNKYSFAENTNSIINASLSESAAAILKRMLEQKSRKRYSPQLRSFALTLNFYSNKAYEFVRKTFCNCLPHPRTLTEWYRSVDGSPGMTAEAARAIRFKVEHSDHQILCNLVLDEMAIMRRVEWTGKKFTGFVDIGTQVAGDQIPEAKEALVFMLVAINGHWKIPIGYFFVDSLDGSTKANIVNNVLKFVHQTGVIVTSITFDGAPSNINMIKILGASFPQDMKTYFNHPITGEKVYVIFDICHMLKLVRNCLANRHILKTADDKSICWHYFQKLVEIQETEGLQAATKLKKRHMNWFREKMKVSIAAQTFSASVADAFLFLGQTLKMQEFSGVEETEKFTRIMNNLFDICNSRSLFAKNSYQRALSPKNADHVFAYLKECEQYLRKISLGGVPVLQTRLWTGFVGFIVSSNSIKGIYQDYVIDKALLKYLPTYKLSQDHLEIFFSVIRSKGGRNNNPTARQFEAIYKRLLIHSELRGSDSANAIALDTTSILFVTSSVSRTVMGTDLQESEEYGKTIQDVGDLHFLDSQAWHLTPYSEDIIAYISGFVVKCIKKSITCEECLQKLEFTESLSVLQRIKCRGALINASDFVIKVCKTAEKTFRVFSLTKNIFKPQFSLENLVNSTIRYLPTSIHNDFQDHILDNGPLNSHSFELIKLILSTYFTIRLHHETNKLKDSQQERVRSTLTKAILFRNQ